MSAPQLYTFDTGNSITKQADSQPASAAATTSTTVAVRKRKRPSLVCSICKKKKIKCDKQLPCNNCIKSKCSDACTYDRSKSPNKLEDNRHSDVPSLPYVSSAKNPIILADHRAKKPKVVSPEKSSDEQVTVSLSELNMLKERLQQIESSINVAPPTYKKAPTPGVLPPPIMSSAWNSASPQPQDGSQGQVFATSYNISHTRSQSPPSNGIQLPPLNFNPPPNGISTNGISTNGISPNGISPNYAGSAKSEDSLIGYNPCLNSEDTINFYENYTSIYVKGPHRRVNFGPFAWSSMMRRDRALSTLWDYVAKRKEKDSSQTLVFAEVTNEVNQENNEVATNESNESEATFRKRALEADGYGDLIPYTNILKRRRPGIQETSELNRCTLPLGLTFYEGQVEKELQLIDKIPLILPKKKVAWKLIDRFFTYLYPFMPFVDEMDFRQKIAAIIGSESLEDTPIKNLKVEKRLDLAIIGTFLLIMRMSYLSLFSNKTDVNEERLTTTDPSPEAQDVKYLLQNPISITTAIVANCCLSQFEILQKTSFPVLQLALYLRIYHTYAPEDGGGPDGGESQTLTAVIIQMAYSLGLHRDPDNFNDVLNDKRQNHLMRKIWHHLVLSDIHNCYTFGIPPAIDPDSYDTKIPFHEEGNENLKDKTLDRFTTACYFPSYTDLAGILRSLLKLVLNVRGKIKLEELCKLISEFEVLMTHKYGTLEDCLNPPTKDTHIFARNFPTKFYISLKAFCVSIFYHIFIHYEPIDLNLSFFYMKKIIKIACTDLMPHYFELLGNSDVICDMMINPKLQQIVHSLNQVNLAIIVRVNVTVYYLRSHADHDARCAADPSYYTYYKELCKLSSCLTRCAEFSIAAVSKLSSRYYHAWRITKGHTYLLRTVTTLDFYKDNLKNNHKDTPTNGLPGYSTEQIAELVTMCETALDRVGKNCVMGTEFCTEVNYKQFNREPSSNSTDTTSSKNTDTTATTASTLATDSPSVNNTKSYTNEFGLNLENSSEIDNVWIQMLTFKQERDGESAAPTPGKFDFNDKMSKSPNSAARLKNIGSGAGMGLSVDQDLSLDMFGDLAFGSMFDGDYAF
ncbi:uncharacterized protein SPAPADRAFT_72420 [Spathaspora passalidarum NRRL Y-27907]|uniref:Zn(2)-C6 fungal-type domain-containing protein n=1 Tax=Spathaspora passalidarum (strain NRRL Y-27907 / 11-Y1) TaxID=619300 RepID=G3AQZ7_SPAPN|nr:uncharacterized protein SPAPADRAFT_72420 [Spathaspora passalidarum NRRL Y-27907]EGW31656.1 hypothetical protein SPAPADRAFT_72420 [Spathaspora passalidarum NRRL Y-27907]